MEVPDGLFVGLFPLLLDFIDGKVFCREFLCAVKDIGKALVEQAKALEGKCEVSNCFPESEGAELGSDWPILGGVE